MKKDMRDFTSGPVLKSLIALAGPIVLTNLLHTAYQLTDTFWVGRLGAEAVASVSLTFPIVFLLITLGVGFSLAGTILVAQYRGKGDLEMVNYLASQTVSLMFFVSIFVSILGYLLAEPLMKLMGASDAVLIMSTDYLKISSLGMIFMFSFFVFQSLMRGVGEVKMPMRIVAFTVLLNLILDPFFIMGFGPFMGQGVKGAAIATILTQGIASFIGLYILFRGKNGLKIHWQAFKPDTALIKKMFLLGLPASIEQSMKALGLSIMSFLVASFGTTVMASYGIGIRMLTFVIIPAFGLSMATSTLVGQNIGAGKIERATEIGKMSAKIGFAVLGFFGLLFFIIAPILAATFIPGDAEVIKGATLFIRFLAFSFPVIGVHLILNGVFQGAGDTRTTMIFSIVSLWVFEFPLSYILSKHSDLNEVGIWLAIPIANLLSAIVALTYFRFGRWRNISLIHSKEAKMEAAVLEEARIEEGM